MHDERRQYHAEGEKEDQVAPRERHTARDGQRQGEGRRQRDHTSHPGPGDDHYLPHRRRRVALAYASAEPPRYVGGGEDPEKAREYDREALRLPEREKRVILRIVRQFGDQPEVLAREEPNTK
jgi:hypothetical protein